MINLIKEYWKRFRHWQRTPYEVPPLSDTQHVCLNCGESFNGQFCPRCGQSAKAARFTPKHVLANALDVWGAGNRSMPRNILHLLFKPGYMIADYLKGHRQPYFPPFKMLFIVVTTFIFITYIIHYFYGIKDDTQTREIQFEWVGSIINAVAINMVNDQSIDLPVSNNTVNTRRQKLVTGIHNTQQWLDSHRAVSILIFQVLFAFSAWVCFRNSPRLGKLTLSEQFFAQVFISSQIIILSFIYFLFSLLWTRGGIDTLPTPITMAAYLIDYKQLYGFSWWKTIWRNLKLVIFATFFILTLSIVAIFIALMVIMASF